MITGWGWPVLDYVHRSQDKNPLGLIRVWLEGRMKPEEEQLEPKWVPRTGWNIVRTLERQEKATAIHLSIYVTFRQSFSRHSLSAHWSISGYLRTLHGWDNLWVLTSPRNLTLYELSSKNLFVEQLRGWEVPNKELDTIFHLFALVQWLRWRWHPHQIHGCWTIWTLRGSFRPSPCP